jgi:hypothetical protein
MTALPEPLTSAECDLRDFAFMPLDVLRLRDSDLAALPDAEAFRAAVMSWCVAWHQLPAGSLPDDDGALCRLLGYGRDAKTWARIRKAGALRGWVKCADGRLYHPVVAEKANEGWRRKMAQRERTAAARAARLSQKKSSPVTDDNPPQSQSPDLSVTEDVTSSKGQGQGQGQGQGDIEERASLSSSPRSAARRRALLSKSEIEEQFEIWWDNYPRKVGRGDARKAYEKALGKVDWDPDVLITGLLLQLDQFDRREGGKFIAHPSTWLNGERWADGNASRDLPDLNPSLPLH